MKVLFKLSKNFWHVWISWLKNYLPELQIWIRLLVSWQLSKLAVDFHVKLICDKIFSLEYWTNFFKMELLSVILSHSGIKFDILFNFTQIMLERNWTFENFWHFVLIIARREIQIVDITSSTKSSKNKKFEANL